LSTVVNIHAEAERIANETFQRPAPEAVDQVAERYETAKLNVKSAQEVFTAIEQEAIALVQEYGIVVPRAEKSRRLSGRHAELTVTKSDTLTISDERVEVLKEALASNGRPELFPKLFTLRSKYEVVEGAEQVLRNETVSKRLAEKIFTLFGRCISVKAKKPSLKVVIHDPAAAPTKGRRKKGGE
jgi:hypothetical protein